MSEAAMKRGHSERETCELNGWSIGTRLVGDEGFGPTVIQIKYFTREGDLLAITESRNGKDVNEREYFWTLRCRDWSEVDPAAALGSEAQR